MGVPRRVDVSLKKTSDVVDCSLSVEIERAWLSAVVLVHDVSGAGRTGKVRVRWCQWWVR